MASTAKPQEYAVPVMVGRRSTRLNVAIPITIIGKDVSGESFKERAFTLSVNKHGAEIATSRQLAANEEITIESVSFGRSVQARVVRQAERRSPTSPYEFSIELLKPENVWGIKFPPSDWGWEPIAAADTKGKALEASKAPEARLALESPSKQQPEEAISAQGPSVNIAPVEIPKESPGPAPGQAQHAAVAADRAPGASSTERRRVLAVPEPGQPKPPESRPTEATLKAPPPAPAASVDALARLEERIRAGRSLEEQLRSLADRLQSSCQDLERLLAKSQDSRRDWNAEAEKIRSSLREAGAEATRSGAEELKVTVREALESAARELLDQARSRAQAEVAGTLESLIQEARTRASALREAHISESARELQAHHIAAIAQSKEQIGQAAQAAVSQFEEKIKPTSEEISSSLRVNLERTLQGAGEEMRSRLLQSLREDAESLLHTETDALKASLDKMRQQILDDGACAQATLRERFEQETRRAADEVAERIKKATELLGHVSEEAPTNLQTTYQKIELSLKEQSDRYQTQLAQASSSGLEAFRHYLETVVESSRTELEEISRQAKENAAEGLLDGLHKTVDTALESSASHLRTQVEDSVTLTSEELKRVGKDLLEDCRDQVGTLIRATIGSLTSEVQAIAEEYRRQHLGKFQEITNKCMREIETSVQQAMRREKETFLRQLEDEVEASAARAATRIKAQSEAAAQQASDKIYRQVGEAAVVLKEWADQARERFDARTRDCIETFQKQADELSKASLDKARGQASNLEKSLAARLMEAANLLQAPEPEGSQRKASEVSEPTTQSDPKR